jgi:cellulase/cellobiase CelA1
MKYHLKWALAALPFTLLCQTVQAQNQANVVRDTELKAQPFVDAATLKSLNSNAKVNVLSQKASWMEVQAQGTTGWLKMLSLRFEARAENSGKVLDSVKSLRGDSTTTTSVRGLRKANFLNQISPSPDAFEKVKQFPPSKPEATEFAKKEKLEDQRQDYVKAPGGNS